MNLVFENERSDGRWSDMWHGMSRATGLLRGGLAGLLAQATEVALGVVIAILLARLLGPEGFGVYVIVMALVSLISMPASAGLPPLVVRETARGQRVGDWSAIRGIWHWANSLALSLSVLVAAGGVLVLWLGWVQGEPLRETLLWGLALVPFLALAAVRSACLRGLRHVLAGVFPEQVLRPVLLTGALLVVLLLPDVEIDSAGGMAFTVGASLVAFLVGGLLLRCFRPAEVVAVVPEYRHAAWLSAAWPMALTQGFHQVNRHADVLLLGLLAATVDAGVYRVAAQGALLVSLGLTALNMVFAPYMTRLHVEEAQHKLQNLVRRTAQAALAFAVPATLSFVVFGEWLLGTLFGDEFRGAYWPLLVLAVGQLVNAWFGPSGLLLNMTGHEREVTRAVAVAAVLNVVLNLILIPPFGVMGAAVATSASLVFWNVWLWLVVRWRLGLRCSAF